MYRPPLFIVLLIFGIVSGVAGASMLLAPAHAATAQTEATIAIININEPPFKPPTYWSYSPATITIKRGMTVRWNNYGAVMHTVTADDGKRFDSRLIAPKASYSFTPESAGHFHYHCTLHPWMKGTIIVEP